MNNTEDRIPDLGKKAFEVSYALLRIADGCGSLPFAEMFTKEAVLFLRMVVINNREDARKEGDFVGYLLRLASSMNIISDSSEKLMVREMQAVVSAMELGSQKVLVPDDEIAGLFLKKVDVKKEKFSVVSVSRSENNQQTGNGSRHDSSESRQSAIYGHIRQRGNSRLKDIQAILPDVSERTLRYDFQKLVSDGLLERIGNGGPATFYKAKVNAMGSLPDSGILPVSFEEDRALYISS